VLDKMGDAGGRVGFVPRTAGDENRIILIIEV
jgi:hypothetical protein